MVNKSPKNVLGGKPATAFPKARNHAVRMVPVKKPVKTNGNESK